MEVNIVKDCLKAWKSEYKNDVNLTCSSGIIWSKTIGSRIDLYALLSLSILNIVAIATNTPSFFW